MECNLCEHPYPYNCEQCRMEMEQAFQEDAQMFNNFIEQQQKKIFIGSGEDVCLEELTT